MSLTVYCGAMYSSKSDNLLREITKYSDLSDERHVLIINHSLDTRDVKQIISSHSSMYKGLSDKVDVMSIDQLAKVDVSKYKIIGIDEANFFEDLYITVKKWISMNKHIICVGLDGDSNMNKFGQISDLLHIADKFVKLTAICSVCLEELKLKNEVITPNNIVPAPFTMKIKKNPELNQSAEKIIDIGGSEKYLPVCRKHHPSWVI